MKTLTRIFMLAAVALTFHWTGGNAAAQGGPGMGNFDPQEMQRRMQQQMSEMVRERLVVTNDEEWKVIDGRLSKVMQARMETFFSSMGAFAGMRRGGNRDGEGGPRRFPGFGQPNPESEALQKAVDANAPVAEIKTRLEQLREARKQKQASLAKAQEELRNVLSLRQEAALVTMGILD